MKIKIAANHTWVQIPPVPLLTVLLCNEHHLGPQLRPLLSEEGN